MLSDDAIGGGIVRRTFTLGEGRVVSGQRLTREQILAIRKPNRNSLVEHGSIELFARDLGAEAVRAERFVVRAQFGVKGFDVIEGRKLNDEPLEKADAEALAYPPDGETTRN